jgi:F420-non-reducing hydrogenase iron-sulfur subunit
MVDLGLPAGETVKHIVVYRCQNCGGPGKIITANWAREFVLSCSGQLEAVHILRAFEDGEYGVCVVLCDPANCRTLEGGPQALRRIQQTERLLTESGIDPQRLKTIRYSEGLDLNRELAGFFEGLKTSGIIS